MYFGTTASQHNNIRIFINFIGFFSEKRTNSFSCLLVGLFTFRILVVHKKKNNEKMVRLPTEVQFGNIDVMQLNAF